MARKLDAALLMGDNKRGYFFEGNKYYRYTPNDKVDKGYPKPIAGNWKKWPGLFTNGIDAAVYMRDNKKAYFFKGEWYLRHTYGKGCDPGYPKKIKGNWKKWPSSFTSGVDAAAYNPKKNKCYFFKGNSYIRHTYGQGCDSGYPKAIAGNWKKWKAPFTSGVDAALDWTNDKLYFFKGEDYIRHTIGSGCDANYPKLVKGSNWEGIFRRFSADTVKKILKDSLDGKLQGGYKIFLGDSDYYFLEVPDAESIIATSSVDSNNYTWQKFDCDDFAWILKADFVKDGYDNMERRFPHCVGMVWGDLPGPHAMNWMINSDQKLRLIEPQNDSIRLPKSTDKDIYLLIT